MVFIANHEEIIEMENLDYFLNPKNNTHILYVANLLTLYQRSVSLNLILISFKVLKYLGALLSRVTVMFKVLNHAQSDIIYFFALYLIIFISFTTTFHIFYGSQVDRFSTYSDSFNTLFLYLGRNILRIDEMKEMSFTFTVIYFIIFITSMEFILMNMFIAIIALSYSTVNKQLKDKKNKQQILDEKHIFVSIYETCINITKFGFLARCCKKKQKSKKTQDKNKDEAINDEFVEESNFDGASPEVSPQKTEKKQKENQDQNNGADNHSVNANDIKLKFEERKSLKNESDDESKKSTKKNANTNLESSTKRNQSSIDGQSLADGKSFVDDSENLDEEDEDKKDNDEEDQDYKNLADEIEIWDKKFSPDYFIDDDFVDDKTLESDNKAYERQVKREKKLGRDLWSLISYVVFFAIFSYLIFSHVRVSMFNMYNDALKNNIEGVSVQSGDEFINITQTSSYQQVVDWINSSLSQEIIFEDCFDDVDENGEETDVCNYHGYFINDYNYVLNSNVRFCFNLANNNSNPNSDVGPMPKILDRRSIAQEEDLEDQNIFEKDAKTNSQQRRRKLFNQTDIVVNGRTYQYISNGYQGDGSYCANYNTTTLSTDISNFIQDRIIGDRMVFLSVEFVTYEASNYFYTYSAIFFDFMNNGDINASLNIASLDIRKYHEWYDWIRMIFELIFMFSVFYLIL